MTEGQRKFWISLFGAIAAIVAAIGSGWAVHLPLSYQDNSNTATNGGVVIQDTQGSPVTHTGTGDITNGVHHKGQGNIHIRLADVEASHQSYVEELKASAARSRIHSSRASLGKRSERLW